MAEEKCRYQSRDLASIHIGICHDDDIVITDLIENQRTALLFFIAENTESSIDISDFFVLINLVLHRFLYVQNFSTQRKNSLEGAVAALFSRATCRITLDKKYLTMGRVIVGAIGKLAGKAGAGENAFTLHQLTCLAG